MKFVVSSSALLQRLQSVNRVIASKNTLPILDNFLFELAGNTLTITASDSETTLRTSMEIDQVMEEGKAAVPSKILTDSLKEFPEQPISCSLNQESNLIEFTWATGNFQIPVYNAEDYPTSPVLDEGSQMVSFPAQVLLEGINRTLYAAAEEELRPVINGIFFDLKTSGANLVASDSHKLVCYTRKDILATVDESFILPKKPANILKNLLVKTATEDVQVSFDTKNAYFLFGSFQMLCRLVEGGYPAYRSVIPQNNPLKVIVDRGELMNAVRRVSVCANQATNLLKLHFEDNRINVSAQDLDFRVAAQETLSCQYDGTPITMGFKSSFLVEILSNLPGTEICIALSDPSRVGLLSPVTPESDQEDICALIMPMMITA